MINKSQSFDFYLFKYLKEVREELNKVTWPSREQTTKMTILVIVISLIIGAYVGILDFIFAQMLRFITE